MTYQSKEREERNEFITSTNESETKINTILKINNMDLVNPVTIYKDKTNKIMEYFYNHNFNYFTESYTGNIIYCYLMNVCREAIELSTKIILYERNMTLSNGFRLPIRNPYIESFEEKISELKNFKIDNDFCKKIDIVMSQHLKNSEIEYKLSKKEVIESKKESFDKYGEYIKAELIELGYLEVADTIIEDTLIEIENKKNSFVLKKTVK